MSLKYNGFFKKRIFYEQYEYNFIGFLRKVHFGKINNIPGKTLLLILILLSLINTARAQQMMVDNADITTYRSFQKGTWYGSIESWLLPAIGSLPFLEVSGGFQNCFTRRSPAG